MAGTDKSRADSIAEGPAIILIEPQMGENIGMAARAMLNSGLGDLRLVRPRDVWPNPKARHTASGADAVIDDSRVFETTAAAVADLNRVYAATARPRDMIKAVLTPRRGAAEMRTAVAGGERVGILFGGERAGLDNDDIALADTVIQAPLNPAFSSLNLGHAVLIATYEWYQAGDETPPEYLPEGRTQPATKEELIGFFQRLEAALDACGFMHVAEKRPIMVRNIRNIFQRANLMEQEVRTLHGIVSCLTQPKDDNST
ncbi:MAG: RNA methyltransferase [Alphaproteobacteria bacterium]|nr:RNA methyltransferase [Alphaproteobacteria bacterium]